jgi:predicted NBD/HSP70 family sugar kinase
MVKTPLKTSSGRNLADVRLINRGVIFRSIRDANAISRAELAKNSGLNPATVTHIVRELIDQGLIEDTGNTKSQGGRPSSLLQVRSEAGYIIAVHLDRYFMRAMITNLNLDERIESELIATRSTSSSQINISSLLELIDGLIKKSKVDESKLLGIGICSPGPLDSKRGMLLSPPNFPGWPDTPIRKLVQDRFHLHTFLDQNANACAYGEKLFGEFRESDNFVFILAESGLSGGIFINGDVYRGETDIAGEIGHTTIDFNGPQCTCGNYGCLELYASPQAVEQYVCDQIKSGRKSSVSCDSKTLEAISFEEITAEAKKNDPVCLEAINSMTKAFSIGVTNIVNTFDPSAVVIGGKIALAQEFMREPIQEAIRSRTIMGKNSKVPLYFSQLGQDVQIIGAFSLVLRELFQNPSLKQQPL